MAPKNDSTATTPTPIRQTLTILLFLARMAPMVSSPGDCRGSSCADGRRINLRHTIEDPRLISQQ